jgi:DNA-binding XRE family transcriptional regulator
MSGTNARPRAVAWTEAERTDMRAIAARMQAERPTPAQLVESGNYDGPLPLGVYQDYVLTMLELKRIREELGLSLAEVSERSSIDRAAVSKLENGQTNPTFQTIGRFAASLGKRVRIVLEDLTPAEPAGPNTPAIA